MFNPVAQYPYLLPNGNLSVADIANLDLFACGGRTWISLDIERFYEAHCQLFLRLMLVLCRTGDEVAVVCNPIGMGRWSELMVVRVCHSDEVMREAHANDNNNIILYNICIAPYNTIL